MGCCCSEPATDPETEWDEAKAAAEDEPLRAALEALALQDSDGAACTYVSHRALEPHRRKVMASAFPQCAGASRVVAVVGKSPGGDMREFIAAVEGQQPPSLITGSCQITYEDLAPSECIEYCFAEDSSWAMTQLSLEALETYRGMKFDAWKQMLLKPTCEAQFRRMLQLGMVTRLYDSQVFPTPEALKDKYKVVDERTGKLIELPHPVKELRIWDAVRGSYREVDAHLGGAPAEAEAAAWWEDLLKRLRAEHGEEYISSLAAGR
jgi:hypothetical protein